MKAFILAAGLGTRLKPWTLHHPKALVPVGGVPMLERVIKSLERQGFDDIVVNVHHFADQIEDFLDSHSFNARVRISDERAELLDTGGAILHAAPLLCEDDRPFLIHNVDILSDADLAGLMRVHESTGAGDTMLVSPRDSSRRLVAAHDGRLIGWHSMTTGQYRPAGFVGSPVFAQPAFSGIHVMSPRLVAEMPALGFSGKFSVIDFLLECASRQADGHDDRNDDRNDDRYKVMTFCNPRMTLIDIGKPETLSRANSLFNV